MSAPCKDCPERHPHCHSECEKYAKFKAEREAINNARREQNEKDTILFQSYRTIWGGNRKKW